MSTDAPGLPQVPINDLARYARQVAPVLATEASRVLESGHFVMGPSVHAFEAAFAAYCSVPHCIGVANGTDALELALRAAGVAPGQVVLLAANAAMYGATAVLAAGAEPLFADVDPETGLLTATTLRQALDGATRPASAVIVTHLYGRLAAMDEILALCRSAGLVVVEDCAQAHGAAAADGRKAGSFGDLATFSFYPTKNLGAVGDGGAITCADPGLAARCRQLRQYGWSSKYTNALSGGRNSRLDELQAAFLMALLPDLDARNERRRSIATRYSREISNPRITVPREAGADFVAHLFVVRSAQRDRLRAHLLGQRIGCDIHYPVPDHRQPVLSARYAHIALEATERWCERVLTLPCFPEMTEAEVDRVVAACNAWTG